MTRHLPKASGFRARLAVQYLSANYLQRGFSLSALAKQVGISPTHLSRIFLAYTGVGFRTQLRSLRMKCAIDLLRDPQRSVKEVAVAVGYSHTSSFDRDFRIHFGTSPVDYRCRNVAENGN